MKILITVALLLNVIEAIACVCSPLPDFKNKEDLKSYDFIALVDIKDLAPAYRLSRKNGDIKMNVIELLKGTASSLAVDPAFNSSCALPLKKGEQWLFFGYNRNGKTEVESCTYTMRYRDTTGKREWWFSSGIKQLDLLRKIYNKPATEIKNKTFYPDGKLEIEQSFKNSSLDGLRKIYYPNGKLYIIEKFKNGKHVDYRKSYSISGQLLSDVVYNNDLIKQVKYYHDSTYVTQQLLFEADYPKFPFLDKEKNPQMIEKRMDSLRKTVVWSQLAMIKSYAKNGRSWKAEGYYPTGKLSYKSYMDWDKKLMEEYHYLKDGKLEYTVKRDQGKHLSIEHEYQEDGSRKDFLNDCDLCYIFFRPNDAPEATPESIYIQ
jgi:antitoxin component YwqK of YwqJK toxin-antitoxin module